MQFSEHKSKNSSNSSQNHTNTNAKIIWKHRIKQCGNQNLKQEQPGVRCPSKHDFTGYCYFSQICFLEIGNLQCTTTFSIIQKYIFCFAGLEGTQQHKQKHGSPESWISIFFFSWGSHIQKIFFLGRRHLLC